MVTRLLNFGLVAALVEASGGLVEAPLRAARSKPISAHRSMGKSKLLRHGNKYAKRHKRGKKMFRV